MMASQPGVTGHHIMFLVLSTSDSAIMRVYVLYYDDEKAIARRVFSGDLDFLIADLHNERARDNIVAADLETPNEPATSKMNS